VRSGPSELVQHFREAFRGTPADALRDWFHAQEELRERGDAEIARALADDLWEILPGLPFDSEAARARFFHNAAVFFGSPGPAADLSRARLAFRQTLGHFSAHAEDGWRARALHNLATAIANLGASSEELREAIDYFEEALEWRTAEREIARAVTLHHQGLALRRLAELDPPQARMLLERSATVFREAVEIRKRHGLEEGLAESQRQLRETLARSSPETQNPAWE
jgi:tetratricopeptide (TPR) repeat protein